MHCTKKMIQYRNSFGFYVLENSEDHHLHVMLLCLISTISCYFMGRSYQVSREFMKRQLLLLLQMATIIGALQSLVSFDINWQFQLHL